MKTSFTEKAQALMRSYCSVLNEKDRRQYAAIESLKIGRGGTTYISKVLNIHRCTIIQGIKELMQSPDITPIPEGRQRRKGGGRKKKSVRSSDHSTSYRVDRKP